MDSNDESISNQFVIELIKIYYNSDTYKQRKIINILNLLSKIID